MFIFIIIVVLLLILFMPISLKFNIYFSKDKYYIKLYNINLLSNDDGIIKSFINKNNIKDKFEDYKKNNSKSENKNISENKEEIDKKILFEKIYKTLKKNKFKPAFKFDSNIVYSLGDASITAISFGLFYNINPILINLFSVLFKVKLFKNDFKPIFKDEILFELTISSIITFNLVQIIYIFFIIYKSTQKNRRWIPILGSYYVWYTWIRKFNEEYYGKFT